MGVRRLFSRGGQNFPGGAGGKNILFALRMPKNILFSFKKVKKHTILVGQGGGGASAPSYPPLRTLLIGVNLKSVLLSWALTIKAPRFICKIMFHLNLSPE